MSRARVMAVAAVACGILAIAVLPIVLGPLGMVLGLAAHNAGDRAGMPGAVVAALGMFAGFVLIVLLA